MMNRQLILTAFTMAMALTFTVQAASPDGFWVWSDGSHSTRELKWQKLEKDKGPVGEIRTICKRGEFSDIECCISFDGKYVAFARELEKINCCYDGPGDYHMYGNYDIYVVKIDGALPAVPKKVGHGYWPSWGDDSDQPTKTLYYSWVPGSGREKDQELKIMKTTITPDGTLSEPREHIQLATSTSDPHMQCSPDGRYVAGHVLNNKVQIYDSKTGRYSSKSNGGCHPSWGSNSYWLYWANSMAKPINNGEFGHATLKLPYHYYCGWSNDMKWNIGVISGRFSDQNTPHELGVYSVVLSSRGEPESCSSQFEFKVSKGTWCDLHVNNAVSTKRISFDDPMVNNGNSDLNLKIKILASGNFTGEAYNIKGVKKTFIDMGKTPNHSVPLYGSSNGISIIRLNADRVNAWKKVSITR